MTIQDGIAEYQAALEANILLSEQETAIKQERIAARDRLSKAKDALRWFEQDLLAGLIS